MELNQIKRLKELKKQHAYNLAAVSSKGFKATDDAELLELLEIVNFQSELTKTVNEFIQRDFFKSNSQVVRLTLGCLAHMAASTTKQSVDAFGMNAEETAEEFINLFKTNLKEV